MKLKRILSILMIISIILTSIPINGFIVLAQGDDPTIGNVTVTKTYKDINQIQVMHIEVTGTNLSKLGRNPVIVRDENGNPIALSTIVENDYRLYYKIDNPLGVTRLSVNQYDYNLGEVQMPSITSIDPPNRMVSNKEEIIVNGNGFKNSNTQVNFFNRSGLENNGLDISDDGNKITKKFLENSVGGPYRVEFKYTDQDKKLTLEDNYPNLFTLYGELGVKGDITMVPNQGPTGAEVKIKAEELLRDMSVFFLKSTDGSDEYTVANRGIFVSYGKDVEENDRGEKIIDVVTVRVPPGLGQGRYYVILTNDVNNEKDLEGKIVSTKDFPNNIFTVIDNNDTISITDVTPSKGPETGIDAIIQGRYIGTLSPNVFTPNTNSKFEIGEIIPSSTTLEVSYKPETAGTTIGKYRLIGGEEGVDVEEIRREITVLIGGKATFREGSTFSQGMDKINIKVPSINLQDGEDPAKAVDVVVTTTIKYKDGTETKTITITEEGRWRDKFLFEPINYKPRITSIVPDRIPVDGNNEIAESFKISITGDNFLKYRYVNKDGETKVKQPTINLGGQIILDPNITESQDSRRIPVEDMKIFNKEGIEIDGTINNDLGNKILVTIPKGVKIDPNILNIISRLTVTNPIKNDEDITNDEPDRHMGLSGDGEIRFIRVTHDKTPSITTVTPDTITTSGEKGIVITGQNFSQSFTLYMDGERISNARRNGTGTQITFDAPAKPEGYVQLIVQNDDGALAVYDNFLYVKTYTDPKIIDFNPKRGTAFTLVDLKGQNLVPPNPMVKDLEGIGFMRLVGTRVFVGGKDINTYTTDHKLKEYTTPADKPILSAKDGNIIGSDYYHSIILEGNGRYYKIYLDTITGKYFLTDGDKDVYEIIGQGDKVFVKKGGDPQVEVTISTSSIGFNGHSLTIKTPYASELIDGVNTITGNKVKVLNDRELYFEVPAQPREGYYDIAIVNPDTKKDERKGNAGFYYFFQPGEEPPKIKEIKPSEGSTEGQYTITISGEHFMDNGPNQKTSVILGGVVVAAQDIVVAPDGRSMTVKVPKYPGDLSTETEMDRKYVNVTVINPGGGSDSKINGFAYIIPISHPRITKLILNKGTAAGGDIVTIEGSDFRYFEPYRDLNNNGTRDEGEPFTDKNNNGRWDDLRKKEVLDELKAMDSDKTQEENWDKYIEPILPTVYFGDKIAKIKSFTTSTIDVETPKGVKGPVQVYIVNNDYGVSNTLAYTYEASNPRIRSITPNVGKKQGGDKVEILGEGFEIGDILVYDNLTSLPKAKEMVQIQFGNTSDTNMSNNTLPLDNPGSGRIRDQKARARAGQLEVNYDASGEGRKLNISLIENNIEYKGENIPYNDEEVFLPLNLSVDKDNKAYEGKELLRIRLDKIEGATNTYRIRLDRGFSPDASLANPGHINVSTPSYYTVGDVGVNLINPDGGIASGNFQYKNPDSDPTITNILRDGEEGYKVEDGRIIILVNYLGGNTMEIIGEDFRRPLIIKIGDSIIIPHSSIEYHPEGESVSTRLIFEMPPVDKNLVGSYQRVVVENEDGGNASSEPRFIKFTEPESTSLAITSITPNFGPTEGGTTITIKGKDFRSQMDGFPDGELKVYFGSGINQIRVPAENIVSVTFDEIVLRTPPYKAGPADVKVENPDGNVVILPNGFTYVSNPKISSVVNPDNEKMVIENISVEGGEVIKILGSDFMEGAKVIFTPVLRQLEEGEQATGEIITIGTKRYVLESGVEGTEVEVISGQEILVTTPSGKLGEKGLIVINPDKGATNIYNLVYGIPEIGAPFNVVAEVVFDEFIRVHWTGVRDALEYEIYMSENGGKFEFIGSTELTSFAVQKIKAETRYQFLVRAIGKYGTSKPIDESKSNIVTTSRTAGPKDNDGKLGESTLINRNGNVADIVIGSKDFTPKGMTIDLTRGNLAGVKDITLRIPANIVVNSPGEISIIGKDYNMKLRPGVFSTSTLRDNKDNPNAGIVFKVFTYKGNIGTSSGNTVLGESYNMEASIYIDKETSKMDYLNGNISFKLDHDILKAQSRRLTNIGLMRYDNSTKNWTPANTLNRLGIYTVIGRRG